MSQPYVGEIRLVGFNFAPVGWALCNGQLLPISQNPTLFQLIGTTYGGDGQSTFALPQLQGRVPIHQGQGSGLSSYVLGQLSGSETVTLTTQQIPAHNHPLLAVPYGTVTSDPTNNLIVGGTAMFTPPQTIVSTSSSTTAAGGGQPHDNMQ